MAETEGNSHVAALLEDRRWACALARSLVHDEHLADDVVQSAYLATLQHAPPREVPARAWFAGVVRNVARMTLRGGARRKARERTASKSDSAPSAEALVALAEQHHRLAALVVDLEEPYRSAIVQRYFGGLEPSEIAARSGEPAATVRSRIKRGLEKLRCRLEDAEGASWRSVLLPLAAGPAALPGASAILSAAAAMKVAALVLMMLAIGATAWRIVTGGRGNEVAHPSAVSPHHVASGSGAPPSPGDGRAVIAPREFGGIAAMMVTGRVVDPTGAPVAGARVLVFPLDIDRTIAAAKPDETGGLARFGFTDDFGRFELTPGRASGLVNICAEHLGFAPAILESRRIGDDVVLALQPGRTMSGKVSDAGGSPVPGAVVRWHSVVCGVSFDREAIAAADGSYEVADLFADSQGFMTSQAPVAEVIVTAAGFATAYLAPPASDEAGRIRLDAVLAPGSTLTGSVVDATTGTPIAGARVAFWSQREPKTAPGPGGRLLPDPLPVKGLSETTADSNGRFKLVGLTSQGRAGDRPAAGSAAFGVVGAIAPGYAAAIRTVSIDPQTGSADVALACGPCGRIRGRLVDASGSALADVPIWLEPRVDSHHVLPAMLSAERGSLVTGADGRFEFDAVRCDGGESPPLEIVARPPGTLGDPFRKRGITARAGEITDVGQIDVGRIARLSVLVTDCAGAPIFGARVSLAPFVDAEDLEGQSVVTNAAGRCEIRSLEPALWMGPVPGRIFARHPGYARGSGFHGLQLFGQDLRIVLAPEHVLRGRVCDDGGAPVVGAQVWLIDARMPRDQAFAQASELETPFDRLPAWYAAVVTSRAGGQFRVQGLGFNRFHVAARRPEGWSREPAVLYDVEAGKDEVVVKLPPVETIAAAGDLEIAVSDGSTSHPVMDARVVAYTPARGDLTGEHALGVHRFTRLPAGVYTVTVQAPGFVEKIVPDVEVATGAARSLEVKLDRGVAVRGTVVRADGLPFLNARIGFVGDDPVLMPLTHPVAYDGSFVARDLLPSRQYVPVVIEPGALGATVYMLPGRGKLTLPADGAELKLRVIAGGIAFFGLGNATSDERDLLRGMSLVVSNSRGVKVYERLSPYKTPLPVSLPPGTYRASIVRGDAVVDEKPFTMSVGDRVEVKLALR